MQQESAPSSGANPATVPESEIRLSSWQKARRIAIYTLGGALAGVFAIAILALLLLLGDRSMLSGPTKGNERAIIIFLLVFLATFAAAIIGYLLGEVLGAVIGEVTLGATAGGIIGFVHALSGKPFFASPPTEESNRKETPT
jgi:hypothetical protein